MGSSTLTINKGTWIYENDQTPHTSDTLLRSDWYTDKHTAVAQFVIPNNLRYKRFINATLTFYSTEGMPGWTGGGVRLSPYKTGDTLNELIWSNVSNLGERGDIIVAERFDFDENKTYPRWRSLDITGIFKDYIVDGTYYTVMINAVPGFSYPNIYDYDHYTGIGNANLSGYETKLILTYEDVPQLPPSPSYPVGTYVSEDTDLLFAWNWETTTGSSQAAVQLEYKLKTAESWTVVSLTQTNHTYLLTGGLSVQGVYQWRIKGTNDAGEVSDYSSIAEFNVVGQPAAPVIDNVPNKALTTITWTTTDQNAFDIQIIDSNNKTVINDSVASSVASYKPNIFLKGSYTAKVRVRNSTGLVSNWGTKAFTINAAGPAAPNIQLYQDDTHILIETMYAAGYNYAVVRTEGEDGPEKILGRMPVGTFTDSTFGFGKQYKYVVRVWESGGYTDSDPERVCYPKISIVLQTEDDELEIDKSEEIYLPYTEDINGEMAVYNCIGRELPVVEHGAFESRAFKTRIYIEDEDQKERLVAMSRKNRIFYRDYSGRAFPVAIQPPITFARWMSEGYMAEMTFIRIADTEVVVNV
jgi:hypothetical protein